MFNLLTEIKNRVWLILINVFFCAIVIYCYKESFFYVLIKKLVLKNNLKFYLIYTNITELFYFYLNIIIFFLKPLSFIFILSQILIFTSYALCKKEFKSFTLIFFLMFVIYIVVLFLLINLVLPSFWVIFKTFENSFIFSAIYFEFKTNDFFIVFQQIFQATTSYFLFLVFLTVIFKKYLKKTILIKFRKVCFILILFLTITLPANDFIIQTLIIFILIFYYELQILYVIFLSLQHKSFKIFLH